VLKPPQSRRWRDCPAASNIAKRLDCGADAGLNGGTVAEIGRMVDNRYQYVASMRPIALAAGGITTVLGFLGKQKSFLKPALCGALLLTLGVLTWRQSRPCSCSKGAGG